MTAHRHRKSALPPIRFAHSPEQSQQPSSPPREERLLHHHHIKKRAGTPPPPHHHSPRFSRPQRHSPPPHQHHHHHRHHELRGPEYPLARARGPRAHVAPHPECGPGVPDRGARKPEPGAAERALPHQPLGRPLPGGERAEDQRNQRAQGAAGARGERERRWRRRWRQ